uniref:NR LBD domain-containing protein n=1 Tax=Ditylenchus dipsaci TaxID=166011 RepID=A0A915E3A5_9BILA
MLGHFLQYEDMFRSQSWHGSFSMQRWVVSHCDSMFLLRVRSVISGACRNCHLLWRCCRRSALWSRRLPSLCCLFQAHDRPKSAVYLQNGLKMCNKQSISVYVQMVPTSEVLQCGHEKRSCSKEPCHLHPSTSFSPPILAKEVNRVKQDTTQTIVKPLQRSLSQTQLVSSMEEHKAEVVQQLLQICSRQSFPEAIVTPLPILNKIKMGYARLQERRDELYGFLDVIGPENARPRRKFQAGHISLLKYAQDNNREINFVAEMLTSFQGFSDIPDSDKLKMFKQFWIQFLILERCYDTFKVVPDKLDSRLVFPEGTIARRGAQNLVRAHRSRDVLLLSLLLFNVSEIAGEISAQTTCFCKDIVESIYEELNTYYAAEFRHKNVLKRIVELMSLISATEKIAMQRREERLMQEVFNIFNTNIFLDSIFED